MNKSLVRFGALASTFVTVGLGAAYGASFTFNFDTYITGGNPVGTNFAKVTFADNGLDSVLVTLDHNATSAQGQFITELSFNLSPYVAVTRSNAAPSNKFNGAIQASENGLVDAGFSFDLQQRFETSNSQQGANRLKPGESVSFVLTGNGLDATDFVTNAVPGGRNDVIAMIHLQGIPGGQSVKLAAVPEPATLAALAAGLLALRRRRASR